MKRQPPTTIRTCRDPLTANVIAAALVREYEFDFTVTVLNRVNVETNQQEFLVSVSRRTGERISRHYLDCLTAFASGANAVVENMIQAPR